MKNNFKSMARKLIVAVLLIPISIVVIGIHPVLAAGTSYYIDCSAASNGSGTQASPWNALSSVNGHAAFVGEDQLLFKRGTTCSGALTPLGSGTSTSSYITIDAYDTGALPIISASTNQYAIKLYNQSYWHIQNIETTGGTRYGIFVNGSGTQILYHFRLTNVVVHNVSGGTMDNKTTGLIVFGDNWTQQFDDVVLDGVTAYESTMWGGVVISGKGWGELTTRSKNIIVRNSIAHNVYGDGIVAYSADNVLFENNISYETGLQTANTIGTPNGIWTWDCNNCLVQFNEAYNHHSPSWDGGGFDIDYFSSNTTLQYNYGHDNDSYCMAVFATEGSSHMTRDSIMRYNICSNNAREATLATERSADLYLAVWKSGSGPGYISNLNVYNNTFYWNPASATAHYAIAMYDLYRGCCFSGTNTFKNNIIYSANPNLMNMTKTGMTFNNNIWWYTGAGNPVFKWNKVTYTSFSAFQSATGQEANGLYTDPLLNSPTYHSVGMPSTQFTLQGGSPAINAGANMGSMGSRDFFGNTIPQGGAYDIGAYESGGAATPTPTATPTGPTPTPAATSTPTLTPTPTNTPTGPTATPIGGPNLLTNAGFETGSESPWAHTDSTVQSNNGHTGTYSMKTTKQNAGFYYSITGLQPNTTYTFSGWAKVGSTGPNCYLFARNYGSTQVTSITYGGTTYTLLAVTFTTGASNTTAEVGLWRNTNSGGGNTYGDDFDLSVDQ